MHHRWLIAVLAVLAASPAAAAVPEWRPTRGIRLVPIASGLDSPLHLTSPPGDQRLFVVEQPGRIRILSHGRLLPRPFLDIRDRVRSGGERGLLSVAFHPRYAENGWLVVDYTDRSGDTRIERYRVSSDPDVADTASARLLLHIPQPYSNHNGGLVEFGPDGMLWIGMGDGGSAGDPHGNAHNPESLLGKLLRIDLDRGDPYAIPPDNPHAAGGGRPEIWAQGLRNPWRWCFDRPTGTLFIADVGQDRWEEVDAVPWDRPGLDFGWNAREGAHPFRDGAAGAGWIEPVAEYGHRDGCSITGGCVYRGSRVPALAGCYVFSDFCSGWIRSFRLEHGRAVDRREWRGATAPNVASFGTDAHGELYVVSLSGTVYAVRAARRTPLSAPRR